jgi:hypothetical protein
VARLSVAAGISSAHVDFGTGTRIFSMSSDFGTAFRCHGDVFAVAAAAPCGLSWGWLLVKVGLQWIGWLLVTNEANVHMDLDFEISISTAKHTSVYERQKSPTFVFATKRCYSYGFS